MKIEVNSNIFFEIDKTDIDFVLGKKWYLGKNGYITSTKYVRGSGRKNQKNESIYLHRLIVGATNKQVVDHKNRNKLDNRRSNLRVCTQKENMQNAGNLKNNTSGYKGVSWSKNAKKWEAFIHIDNKKKNLGIFSDIKDAISARLEAVNTYFTKI